jgi:hypothetical protein
VPAPDEAGEAERDRDAVRAVAAEAEAGRAEHADVTAAAAAVAGEVVRPPCALCGRTCEGPRTRALTRRQQQETRRRE